MSDPSKPQRYQPEVTDAGPSGVEILMSAYPDGDYCEWADIAPIIAERDALKAAKAKQDRDRCETCGTSTPYSGPGCPGCGAPNCCQMCCAHATIHELEDRCNEAVLEAVGLRADNRGLRWQLVGKAQEADALRAEVEGLKAELSSPWSLCDDCDAPQLCGGLRRCWMQALRALAAKMENEV